MTCMHFKKHLGELVLFDDTELQGHLGMRDNLSDPPPIPGGAGWGGERESRVAVECTQCFPGVAF